MKKNRLIILGGYCIGSVANALRLAELDCKERIEIVTQNMEAENIVKSQFDPEPILFHNMEFEYKPIKTEEPQRNKFFDKPRNNFKRR
jgi:hypothetical protein